MDLIIIIIIYSQFLN